MKVILVLATMMIGQLSYAVCDFPGKPLRISRSAGTGLTEVQFNQVIDKFSSVYTQEMSKHGFHLKMIRKWSDDTVNSDTTHNGSDVIINAYGGLARFPGISANGYLMVLCHEAGHSLAGFPKYGRSWASGEGQSDYYGGAKCFGKFVGGGEGGLVPGEVTHKCQMQHSSSTDIHKCEQSSIAGMNISEVLNKLNGGGTALSYSNPDPHKVMTTDNTHPRAQCRLDSYFNGAACGVSSSIDFSDTEPKQGACSQEKGDTVFYRPNCWYAPSRI